MALWADQSGNGNDGSQSSGALKPTFRSASGPGGRPCVTFGGGTFLTLVTALARQNYTIFAVCKPSGGGNKTIVGGPNGSLQLRIDAAQKQELLSRNTASIGLSSTGLSTAGFQQINVRWDGTTATFRLNSAADGSAVNATAFSDDPPRIGITSSGAEGFNGDICAVRVYTSVLTLGEVQTVEAELASRWGVT